MGRVKLWRRTTAIRRVLENFANHERNAFNGDGLEFIVRAAPGQRGAINLHARGEGLSPADVTIRAEAR